MTTPLVTVIIPAKDEEEHIETCLKSILAQDYPPQRLEIIVVDGVSQDRTAEIARKGLHSAPLFNAEVVTNENGSTPSNLNVGLTRSRGEIVCRVDARSLIPPDYVRRCASVLQRRPEIAVVGGAQVAQPPRADSVGRGIARALNNRWAMGLARYRRGAASGPADTVYLGAFRSEQLRGVGGWELAFTTNQDFELNRRMSALGSIWYDAGLRVGYVPRSSLLDLCRQYRRFGEWKVSYWRSTGDRPLPRQWMALLVPPSLGLMTLAWVRDRRTRSRRIAGIAASTVIIALGVDEFGSQQTAEPATLGTRAYAVLATTLVPTSWCFGLLVGVIRLRENGWKWRLLTS